jgi:hypothetical protein
MKINIKAKETMPEITYLKKKTNHQLAADQGTESTKLSNQVGHTNQSYP